MGPHGFSEVLYAYTLTVFLVGMMIGRTPEFLGKKVEAREMKKGGWHHAGERGEAQDATLEGCLGLIDAHRGQHRIAAPLGAIDQRQEADEHHEKGTENAQP